MNLTEYLQFLANAKSLEELWPAHVEQMENFGFNRLIYGCTQHRTQTSLGDPEDFIILSNHCKDYVDGFVHNGLYFHAPMLQWALESEGACSWSVIGDRMANQQLTPEQEKVHEFNAQFNVRFGYTVSFKAVSARSKGAISLCSTTANSQDEIDAIWDEHGDDILLMNNIAHLKILQLPYNPPNRGLTKRQREALEWVCDGKTMQDIAILMGLTTATVEKHLRLAREALSVETTAQAVLKAALHNQMFVIESEA